MGLTESPRFGKQFAQDITLNSRKNEHCTLSDVPNATKSRRAAADFVPPLGYEVFLHSSVIAIALLIVFSLPDFNVFQVGTEGNFVEKLTFWLDPLLLNAVGVILASIIIFFGCFDSGHSCRARCTFAFALPSALLVFAYGLTYVVLKPSFAYAASHNHLPPPLLFSKMGIDLEGTSATPSGSILSQIFMIYLGIAYFRGFRHWKREFPAEDLAGHKIERLCLGLLIFTFFVLAFTRIYRGFHTVFDVAITVGVATYLFWLMFYVIARYLSRVHPAAPKALASTTIINIPLFLFYSQDAHWWIGIFVAVIWILGIVQIMPQKELHARRDP
jgi:hypothetical protein